MQQSALDFVRSVPKEEARPRNSRSSYGRTQDRGAVIAQLYDTLDAHGITDLKTKKAIAAYAFHESGLNPGNQTVNSNETSLGLLQLGPEVLPKGADWRDINVQIESAKQRRLDPRLRNDPYYQDGANGWETFQKWKADHPDATGAETAQAFGRYVNPSLRTLKGESPYAESYKQLWGDEGDPALLFVQSVGNAPSNPAVNWMRGISNNLPQNSPQDARSGVPGQPPTTDTPQEPHSVFSQFGAMAPAAQAAVTSAQLADYQARLGTAQENLRRAQEDLASMQKKKPTQGSSFFSGAKQSMLGYSKGDIQNQKAYIAGLEAVVQGYQSKVNELTGRGRTQEPSMLGHGTPANVFDRQALEYERKQLAALLNDKKALQQRARETGRTVGEVQQSGFERYNRLQDVLNLYAGDPAERKRQLLKDRDEWQATLHANQGGLGKNILGSLSVPEGFHSSEGQGTGMDAYDAANPTHGQWWSQQAQFLPPDLRAGANTLGTVADIATKTPVIVGHLVDSLTRYPADFVEKARNYGFKQAWDDFIKETDPSTHDPFTMNPDTTFEERFFSFLMAAGIVTPLHAPEGGFLREGEGLAHSVNQVKTFFKDTFQRGGASPKMAEAFANEAATRFEEGANAVQEQQAAGVLQNVREQPIEGTKAVPTQEGTQGVQQGVQKEGQVAGKSKTVSAGEQTTVIEPPEGYKVISRGKDGTPDIVASPDGIMAERFKNKGKLKWRVLDGKNEYVGLTPESAVEIAKQYGKPDAVTPLVEPSQGVLKEGEVEGAKVSTETPVAAQEPGATPGASTKLSEKLGQKAAELEAKINAAKNKKILDGLFDDTGFGAGAPVPKFTKADLQLIADRVALQAIKTGKAVVEIVEGLVAAGKITAEHAKAIIAPAKKHLGEEAYAPKNISTSAARLSADLPAYKDLTPEKIADLHRAAEASYTPEAAYQAAVQSLTENRSLNRIEETQIAMRLNEVTKELGELRAAGADAEATKPLRDVIDTLTTALRDSGSESARDLNARKYAPYETLDPEVILADVRAKHGQKAADAVENKVRNTSENVKAKEKELADTVEAEAKADKDSEAGLKDRAQKNVSTTKTKRPTPSKIDKIRAKRETLISEWKRLKSESGGRMYSGVPLPELTAEQASVLGKIAWSYVEEGVAHVEGIVSAIRRDVDPDIDERHVWSVLAPRKNSAAMTEAKRIKSEIRAVARQLQNLEDAIAGITQESQPHFVSARVSNLRKQIARLYKEWNIRSGQYEASVQKSLRTQLADLQKHVENLTFPETKTVPPESPAVRQLRDKIRDMKQVIAYRRRLIDNEMKITAGGKWVTDPKVPREKSYEVMQLEGIINAQKDQLRQLARSNDRSSLRQWLDIGNIFRTQQATADTSALFRQLVSTIKRHPKVTLKQFGVAFRGTFSKEYALRWEQKMMSDPEYQAAVRDGLYLPRLEESRPSLKQEEYYSTWAEKVPFWGEVVRGSNRNMTIMTNGVRFELYKRMKSLHPDLSEAQFRSYVDLLNKVTGRGNLGKGAAMSEGMQALTLGIFSPSFTASRVQMPLKMLTGTGVVRAEAIKYVVTDAVVTLTIMKLGEAAGLWEANLDPFDSDFGKMRIGRLVIDPWGGYAPFFRLGVRTALKTADSRGLIDSPEAKAYDLAGDAQRTLLWYKTSPLVNTGYEVATGKTKMGDETSLWGTAARSVSPISFTEAGAALESDGPGWAGTVLLLNMLGIGTNVYDNKEPKSKK